MEQIILFETVSGQNCVGKLCEDNVIKDVVLIKFDPVQFQKEGTLKLYFMPYLYPYDSNDKIKITLDKTTTYIECPKKIADMYTTAMTGIIMPGNTIK